MPETRPHDHLYTRLKPSPGKGIGVFAIRDIPEGTNPFAGDNSPMIRVPAAVVDALEPDLRQMYLDFCPLNDGAYLAPPNLNLLTLAWYMNESDTPNVTSDENVIFRAARLIRKGEELFIDYSRFSGSEKQHSAQG